MNTEDVKCKIREYHELYRADKFDNLDEMTNFLEDQITNPDSRKSNYHYYL